MPHIKQMFPSKFMQPEDLEAGVMTAVTIERVELLSMQRKSMQGEPEAEWIIKFTEFRKPFRLKGPLAKGIASTLGSDRTEDWVGQRINIYPIQTMSFGELKTFVNCDVQRPLPTGPALPGTTTVGATDNRILPRTAVDRFLAALAERGANWDDFLRWVEEDIPF
jgi:hypothetical protein